MGRRIKKHANLSISKEVHDLLVKRKEETGVPILRTAEDAIRAFLSGDTDKPKSRQRIAG